MKIKQEVEETTELIIPQRGDNKQLIKELQKTYKEDLAIGLDHYKLDFIPSGSFELDVAMGTGGFPTGRISIVAGKESSGKTTLALKTIANAQKKGLMCAYIDVEAAFDIDRAKQLGIDVDALLVLGANTLEVAGEATVDLARSGNIDVIVFDSVAATSIKSLESGDINSSYIGQKAKMLGHLMAKLTGPVWKNNICMIFINQLRDSLDPYKPLPVMPGGHALPYAASIIVQMTSKKSDEVIGGILVKAKISKNKLNVPFKEAEFIINPDGSVDLPRGIAYVIKENIDDLGVTKSGSWYTVPADLAGEEKTVQGESGIHKLFKDDLEACETIKGNILNKYTRMIVNSSN